MVTDNATNSLLKLAQPSATSIPGSHTEESPINVHLDGINESNLVDPINMANVDDLISTATI